MTVNAGSELAARLRVIREKAAAEAPVAACKAMGQAGETAVKVTLTSSSHPPGTPTPSMPGQPPSLVTGRLRRSVHRTQARLLRTAFAQCAVGPVVIYGPVQEYGATIHAGARGYLANRVTGQFFVTPYTAKGYVTLPPRPFMRPAAERLAASGLAARAAAYGWNSVMDL